MKKVTDKAPKAVRAGGIDKKKKKSKRKESFSIYIYKVILLFIPSHPIQLIQYIFLGPEAGAPRHWCLVEDHVHHELVRE